VRRILPLLALSAAFLQAEKWTIYRQGPFAVATDNGRDEAQAALNTLVQLHHTLSEKFGKDLSPMWPLTVVHKKGDAAISEIRLARETYLLKAPPGDLPRQSLRAVAELLIRENTARMNPEIEQGVAQVFATLSTDGPRVTLGAPPPPAERDLPWARMHLLLTDPRYSGKSRVLLSNVGTGVESEASWKNTVGMLRNEFDAEAKKYLAAAIFETTPLNVNPSRFRGEEMEEPEWRLLRADAAGTEAAYREVLKKFPDLLPAKEGLALLTGKPLKEAQGARALAQINTKEALEKAWRLNPRWPQPHEQLAALEEKQSDKAQRFRKAAELAPREVRLWSAAAEAFEAVELYTEASKMWLSAERAAATQAERDRLRDVRLASGAKRADAEEAERRRIAEAERQELARIKNEALERIRAAEAKTRTGPDEKPKEVVEWWDGPKPDAKAAGQLLRVDCLAGGALRIALRLDDKTSKTLRIPDPARIVVTGGNAKLGCGPQTPPKRVTVEYFNSGEVASLTFAQN
jgi:hypothetical protein